MAIRVTTASCWPSESVSERLAFPASDTCGVDDTPEPAAGPRASNADRERFAGVIQRHFSEGTLSAEEFSDRIDRALGARTLGELYELVADLPQLPAVDKPDGARRGGRSRWWRRR